MVVSGWLTLMPSNRFLFVSGSLGCSCGQERRFVVCWSLERHCHWGAGGETSTATNIRWREDHPPVGGELCRPTIGCDGPVRLSCSCIVLYCTVQYRTVQ
jgi:hypothetical protein